MTCPALVRIVDDYGTPVLRQALTRCAPTETGSAYTVATAHKAKGREWPTVELYDDFDLQAAVQALDRTDLGEVAASRAELMLAYVALTRARDELGCGPIADQLTDLRISFPAVTPVRTLDVDGDPTRGWLVGPGHGEPRPPVTVTCGSRPGQIVVDLDPQVWATLTAALGEDELLSVLTETITIVIAPPPPRPRLRQHDQTRRIQPRAGISTSPVPRAASNTLAGDPAMTAAPAVPTVIPMLAADQTLLLVVDNPHTLTGPAGSCLSCDEELTAGMTYAFATHGDDTGIVGDCCLTW